MTLMNEAAQLNYPDQDERFRSLIEPDNRHLAIYTACVKLPRAVLKKINNELRVLQDFLTVSYGKDKY